ncbi:MAG: hypothetical protein AB7D29_07915 [Campylobacterales bacterium]
MIVKYVNERERPVKDGQDPYLRIGQNYIVFSFIFKQTSSYVVLLTDASYGEELYEWDAKLFDIVDDRIPQDWVLNKIAEGEYSIHPKEFMDGFPSKFNDEKDELTKVLFKIIYEKLKKFHNIMDEKDGMLKSIVVTTEKTATAIGEHWVMCPECAEAFEVDENIKIVKCPNSECGIYLNNPIATAID